MMLLFLQKILIFFAQKHIEKKNYQEGIEAKNSKIVANEEVIRGVAFEHNECRYFQYEES